MFQSVQEPESIECQRDFMISNLFLTKQNLSNQELIINCLIFKTLLKINADASRVFLILLQNCSYQVIQTYVTHILHRPSQQLQQEKTCIFPRVFLNQVKLYADVRQIAEGRLHLRFDEVYIKYLATLIQINVISIIYGLFSVRGRGFDSVLIKSQSITLPCL